MTVVSRGYTPKNHSTSLFPSPRVPNTVGQSSSMGARSRKEAQVSAKEKCERDLATLMRVAEQRRRLAEAEEEERRKQEAQKQKALARQQLRQQKKIMYIAANKIQRAARRYLAWRKIASANILLECLTTRQRRGAVTRLARACRAARAALLRFAASRRKRLMYEAQRANVAQAFVQNVVSHCLQSKRRRLWQVKLHICALRVQTQFRVHMERKKLQAHMAKFRRFVLSAAAAAAAPCANKLQAAVVETETTDSSTSDSTVQTPVSSNKVTSSRSDPARTARRYSRHVSRTARATRSTMSAAAVEPKTEIERLAKEDPEKYQRICELHRYKGLLSELELERRRRKIQNQKARKAEKQRMAEMIETEEMLERNRHKEAFMQELLDTQVQEARKHARIKAMREKRLQERQAQAAALAARESEERSLMAKEELIVRMIMREKKLVALRARRELVEQQARETEAQIQAERHRRMQELKELGQRVAQQRLHEILAKEAQTREEKALKAKKDADRVAKFNESFNEVRRQQLEQLRKRKEAEEKEIAALLEEEDEQSVTLELELQKINADTERMLAAQKAATTDDKNNQDTHSKREKSSDGVHVTSALALHDLRDQKMPRNLAPELWSSPYIVHKHQHSRYRPSSHPIHKKRRASNDIRALDRHLDGNNDVGDDDDDDGDGFGGLTKMASILAMVRKARTALDASGTSPAPAETNSTVPQPYSQHRKAVAESNSVLAQRGHVPTISTNARAPSPAAARRLHDNQRKSTPQHQLAYQHLLDIAMDPTPDKHAVKDEPRPRWRDDDDARPGTGGGYTDEEFENDFEDEIVRSASELPNLQPSSQVARVGTHRNHSPDQQLEQPTQSAKAIDLGTLNTLLAQTLGEYLGKDHSTNDR